MYGFIDTIEDAKSTSLSIHTVFNNNNLDDMLTDDNGSFNTLTVSGRSNVKQRINLIDVPGMHGLYEDKLPTIDAREIVVKYRLSDKTNEGFRDRFNKLNALLTGTKQVLKFTDENAIFYATLSELDVPEEEANNLIGTITFLCTDPYKYGPEKTLTFPADIVTIENKGTAETDPIFTMNVLEDTTHAIISNGEEYMMIGRPTDALEMPKNPRPLALGDNASSLVGWTNFTSGYDFFNMGIVGGKMGVIGGYGFTPDTWGTNPNGWTGPAIRKSLSEPLQDFEVEIDVAMLNRASGVGTIRVVGLDENDKAVFSMGMLDPTNGYPNNRAIYGLGENNATWFTYQGDQGKKVWNNGRFLLKITRKGREFSARIARKLDPKGHAQTGRHNRKEIFTNTGYQRPISQIAIYIATARHYVPFGMIFHHLAVRKLIDLKAYEVPLIAQADDEIVFDYKNAECLVNGDPVPFDFGADFFTLKKGKNILTVLPENTFETSVKYRDKFL